MKWNGCGGKQTRLIIHIITLNCNSVYPSTYSRSISVSYQMNIRTLVVGQQNKIRTSCYLVSPNKQNKYSPLKLAANTTKLLACQHCQKDSLLFYVLLMVHLDTILVNNQLDAQLFFVYIYFNSLHVSSTHVLIIGGTNCINRTSGICHST